MFALFMLAVFVGFMVWIALELKRFAKRSKTMKSLENAKATGDLRIEIYRISGVTEVVVMFLHDGGSIVLKTEVEGLNGPLYTWDESGQPLIQSMKNTMAILIESGRLELTDKPVEYETVPTESKKVIDAEPVETRDIDVPASFAKFIAGLDLPDIE